MIKVAHNNHITQFWFVIRMVFVIIFLMSNSLFILQSYAQDGEPIRDNSFFVEEAFNQEKGVVQHISNLYTDSRFKNFFYTFTQEWPVRSEKNQLSYTIPLIYSSGDFRVGDIFLNYRYQLIEEKNLYLAPRFSAIIPTGEMKDGNRRAGFQINVPLSYEWKNTFAFHLNAGTTHLWNTRENNNYSFLLNYAGSVIWLTNSHFNLMCEAVYTSAYNNTPDHIDRFESFILNPGIRGAINFKSGLQIVPGFSTWFDVLNHENGFFFYLSFEHPFQKLN